MKKFISLLLCTAMLISLFCVSVNAAEDGAAAVPKIYVTTDDGNGGLVFLKTLVAKALTSVTFLLSAMNFY